MKLKSCSFTLSIIIACLLTASEPNITILSGQGPHPTDTTQMTLQVATDIPADCRCSGSPGYPYGAMYTNFTNSDGLNHALIIDGLYAPQNTTYYVRCKSRETGTASTTDLSFPVIFGSGEVTLQTIEGEGPHPSDVSEVRLVVQSDQVAELRLSHSPGHPFESMYLKFDSFDGTNHSYLISGIYRGETTTYYIRSKSLATGIITEKDYLLTVTIDSDGHGIISMLETVPTHQTTSVNTATPIYATFSESIESEDTNISFTLSAGGNNIDGNVHVSGNTANFYPLHELQPNTSFLAHISGTVSSKTLEETQFQFTTAVQNEPNRCDNTYPEDFELVSGYDNSLIPFISKPEKSEPFTDLSYDTCITRLTDHQNEAPAGFARVEYSRKQAFNADNTMIVIMSYDGFWHVYDANTGDFLKTLDGPATDCELKWDPTRPNTMYYTAPFGGLLIYELNVDTNAAGVVGNFENRLPWESARRIWTKAEGTYSADGRFWGMQVEGENFEPLGLMVWDKQNDEIVGTWDFAQNGVGRPDHTSMSPSGDFIVASWDGNDYGTTAFSRDFTNQVKLHHKSEHSDLALLPNGHDAYVAVDYQHNQGEVFMIDIQTGQKTHLFGSYTKGSVSAFHFSGKAYQRPGWVLVSTYGGSPSNDGSQVWMHEKIFALELQANPRILHIAHHHSLPNGYWTEPHATVNRDFTRIAFNSNWENNSETDIDVYQIILPPTAIPALTAQKNQ